MVSAIYEEVVESKKQIQLTKEEEEGPREKQENTSRIPGSISALRESFHR